MRVVERVEGQQCSLIPYERHHVPKYHAWMQNKELIELTASEPLSLEEEYEMRTKWEVDEDKLTFIILTKNTARTKLSDIDLMIGDVNLFLHDYIQEKDVKVAEVEIMIAEPTARRKGIATEAVRLVMIYGIQHLGVQKFIAKIGEENLASIELFTKKLNFKLISKCNVFKEATLELNTDLHPSYLPPTEAILS